MNYQYICLQDSNTGNSNLATTLQHVTIGPQLQRLSFAYSKCLLCVEGSRAFEHKMADQLSKLYAMARHCGISLQYFFSSDSAMTEVAVVDPVFSCVSVPFVPTILVKYGSFERVPITGFSASQHR